MAAIDNAAKVRTAILAEIERQCFGEDYGVDVSMQLAQSPTGVMPVWALVFTARSPLLGRGPLVHIATIPSVAPNGEQIEQAVAQGIKALRELSMKILTGDQSTAIHPR